MRIKYLVYLILLFLLFPITWLTGNNIKKITNRATYANIIFNNLKSTFIGPVKETQQVATELSYWKFVREYTPNIIMTPEAITVDSKGRIKISNDRKLIVTWSDNLGLVYKLESDAINKLITYKHIEPPDFYFGVLSGIMATKKNGSTSADAYFGFSVSWNFWFDFNIFGSIGYPGVCGGISLNILNPIDIFIGSALDYDKDLNIILGINARL